MSSNNSEPSAGPSDLPAQQLSRPHSPPLTPIFPPHQLTPDGYAPADRLPFRAYLKSKHPHLWGDPAADTKAGGPESTDRVADIQPLSVPAINPVTVAIKATEEYMRVHSVPETDSEYQGPRSILQVPLSPPCVGPADRPGNYYYDLERKEWIVRSAALKPVSRTRGKAPAKKVAFKLEVETMDTAREVRRAKKHEKEERRKKREEEEREKSRAELKGSISEPVGLIGQARKRREEKRLARVE